MFSKTDCCRIIGHTACMTDKEALLTEFSQRFRRLMNELESAYKLTASLQAKAFS